MAEIVYSAQVLLDIERALTSLHDKNAATAMQAVQAIHSAVDVLKSHPLIGRRVEGEIRELVISYGRTGYVALYRFAIASDEVRLLGMRHQQQLGFLP